MKSILTPYQISLTIKRLANQVLENHFKKESIIVIGIQPRGILLSNRIVAEIKKENSLVHLYYGKLDITFRDGYS